MGYGIQKRLPTPLNPARNSKKASLTRLSPISTRVTRQGGRISNSIVNSAASSIASSPFGACKIPCGGPLRLLRPRRHPLYVGVTHTRSGRTLFLPWVKPGYFLRLRRARLRRQCASFAMYCAILRFAQDDRPFGCGRQVSLCLCGKSYP